MISFKELGKGMLRLDGNPAPASGRYWVASGTGDVVKTELLLERKTRVDARGSSSPTGSISPVDSWVPAEMDEFYAGVGGRLADFVVGKAK